MGEKQGITREELARRVKEATAHIPKLDKLCWRTIFLSLVRERRRVQRVLDDAIDALPEGDPDVNAWIGKLRGEMTHINRILGVIGQDGRKMLIQGVGRSIFIVEDAQESEVALPDPPSEGK